MANESSSTINDTIAQALSFLIRRRWWILGPACLVTLAGIGALFLIPNRYTSSATLLVIEQQVPQRYVVPNSTSDFSATLEAMKQDILSRTRLLKMIGDLDLYPQKRKQMAPEELAALFLSDIQISPVGQTGAQRPRRSRPADETFNAIQISYTADEPALAQRVTNTLTSVFVTDYLKAREEQASNTTRFLRQQVEAKKKSLEEQEQLLREFKLSHVGELPEQQQSNLGILTGLQAQLQNTSVNLNRAQQQRTYLESLLSATTTQSASDTAESGQGAPTPVIAGSETPIQMAQANLSRLQTSRLALLSRYTQDHPDVVKLEREIAKADDELNRLRAAAGPQTADSSSATHASQRQNQATPPPLRRGANQSAPATGATTVAQIRSQLDANRVEIQNLSKDEARLKASIAVYEGRLNQAPIREQQQASLIRATQMLRTEYEDLQKKEQESQLATNLEQQQGGQQFRLVDPASLPTVPSSPNRLKLSLGAAAAGLGVGLGLALLMEMKDQAFHSEKEILAVLSPPLVLSLPVILTPAEHRTRFRRYLLEWAGAGALVVAVLVAEMWVYKFG